MVLLRRLSDDERAIATEGKLDYGIFMAIAERIGHDKRGNVLYRRTPDGDDVLIRSFEQIADIDPATGQEVLREVETSERQIDDELPEVARAYLAWVAEQRR
jgi:type I restriction enzyme M protein